MNVKSNVFLIFFIAVFIVTLLAGVGYAGWVKFGSEDTEDVVSLDKEKEIVEDLKIVSEADVAEEIKEEEPEVDEINTSDWLTYRNEEYGFEVKYPTVMKYQECPFGIEFIYPEQKFTPDCKILESISPKSREMSDSGISIKIYENISFDDFLAISKSRKRNIKEKKVQIDNTNFIQVDSLWEFVETAGAYPAGSRQLYSFTERKDVIYSISYSQLQNELDHSIDYQNIVSSFRFK